MLLHHALAIRAAGFRGHFALDDAGATGAEAKGGDKGEEEAEQFHGREPCPTAPKGGKHQMIPLRKKQREYEGREGRQAR